MLTNNEAEPLGGGGPFVTLKGMYLAKLWIIAPALIALPIMWAFGEGDYIVPIMCVAWALCFLRGIRVRKNAPLKSVERSRGFWISFWSFILAAIMMMLTISFVVDGEWRWKPPTHGPLSNGS